MCDEMRPNLVLDSEQVTGAWILYVDLIESVFSGVLACDAAILEQIRRFGRSFCFVEGRFHFTVPDLFAFLLQRYGERPLSNAVANIEYKAFRRILYGEHTNVELRARGGLVEVACAHTEHGRRVYRLAPVAPTAE